MARVLFSLTDSTGAAQFARKLADLGYEIVATGGTAKALAKEGLTVTACESLTGFAQLLGGRVKTLHPMVHGPLLARRTEEDLAQLRQLGTEPFDLLVCNLYDFSEAAKRGAGWDELIEHIDIGGVALLRAAAKNHAYCPPVCDPADYDAVAQALATQGFDEDMRRTLALKAFAHTAAYDSLISTTLAEASGKALGTALRYGENPWQKASLTGKSPCWRLLGGKELSYNNILDLDAALRALALSGPRPTVALLKHTTPCGMAEGDTLADAFHKAFACDQRSPFGGVAVFNQAPQASDLEALKGLFLELLVLPDIDETLAKDLMSRRKNLRLILAPNPTAPAWSRKTTWAGELIQQDTLPPLPRLEEVTWVGTPRPELWNDLLLAWKAAALAKSNAIALARDGATLAIAGGCTSRVDAVESCFFKAGDRAKGTVLASDAFFPFADNIEVAAKAGVIACIQPGGSKADEEVFETARRLGLSMALTGLRTFRH